MTAMMISTLPTAAAELKSGSSDPNPSWYDQIASVVDAVAGPPLVMIQMMSNTFRV